MLKKGGGGWSVVGVPDWALVPEGAGVRAAGGLYVGVCVCEACGFVCGVGELLGRFGAEGTTTPRQPATDRRTPQAPMLPCLTTTSSTAVFFGTCLLLLLKALVLCLLCLFE